MEHAHDIARFLMGLNFFGGFWIVFVGGSLLRWKLRNARNLSVWTD